MTDPTTMTLDEIRDWAARRKGWRYVTDDGEPYYWQHPRDPMLIAHPIPPTLDAIAGLMPAGWQWGKGRQPHINGGYEWRWWAENATLTNFTDAVDTGNELLDRARLAMLATLAEDEHKEKAQ